MNYRPEPKLRCFRSDAVENAIERVSASIPDAKLAAMVACCLPNTLDTTVRYEEDKDGRPDTFVITGDIEAMWLRDSTNQVWPYLRFAKDDSALGRLLAGVIHRQVTCVLIDPYANAFNRKPKRSDWESDMTTMTPCLHERKYELDSLCAVIRLSHGYYAATGDPRPFDFRWQAAMKSIVATIRNEMASSDEEGASIYQFQRLSPSPHETLALGGFGQPARRCGLSKSPFRPSDDAAMLPFLVPANAFAVISLRQLALLWSEVCSNLADAAEATALADEIDAGIRAHAVVTHSEYGEILAYEIDGFGSHYLMDDANVPSLLSLPYLGYCQADDPLYLRTRAFILSRSNPYYYEGAAGRGIGSPHTGRDTIWPMATIMQALTSRSDDEIVECLLQLRSTDAGTGFMHESFDKDNAHSFSRPWFAWANTIFGELIVSLFERSPELLKAI